MTIYTPEDFVGLREVGALAALCRDSLEIFIQPGMTTFDIDTIVERFAESNNLKCATLGYKGFPAHCCTSVNHVACHGIPSKGKVLKDGDIVSVDITFINDDGYYGDTCTTLFVGQKRVRKAEIVVEAARRALEVGISQVKPGNRIGDIGYAISQYLRETSTSNARDYVGHGIGQRFHEPPNIPHECLKENIPNTRLLQQGMVFTIEPIIILGGPTTKVLPDGWTVVTRDRSLAAQFEHTLGVTEDGVEIFTA
jgi:methionyl aminopeptidase